MGIWRVTGDNEVTRVLSPRIGNRGLERVRTGYSVVFEFVIGFITWANSLVWLTDSVRL